MSADTPLTAEAYANLVRAELADLPADAMASIVEGLDAHLADIVAWQPDLVAALGSPTAYATELRAAAGLPARSRPPLTVLPLPGFDTPPTPDASAVIARVVVGATVVAALVALGFTPHLASVPKLTIVALAITLTWWRMQAIVERCKLSTHAVPIARLALVLAAVAVAVTLGTVVEGNRASSKGGTGDTTFTTMYSFDSVPFPDAADFTSTMVQVANCSDQNGVARMMTSALNDADFTTVDATNGTCDPRIDTSYVIYNEGTPGAQAVAETLAQTLGGLTVEPGTLPIKVQSGSWAEGSGVVLLLGNDLAGKTLDQIQAGGLTGTTTAAPVPTAPGAQGTLLFSVPLADLGGFAEAHAHGEQICVDIQLPTDPMGSCYEVGVIQSGNAWSAAQLGFGYTLLSGLMPSTSGWHVLVGDTAVFPDSHGFWYTALPQGVSEFTIVTDEGMITVSLGGFSSGSGSTTTAVPSP